MERYYQTRSAGGELLPMFKAQRVLEFNPGHPAFQALQSAYERDKAQAEKYVRLLYDLSLLMVGLPPEDPAFFSEQVSGLMAQAK